MGSDCLERLSDSQIPVVRAPNPILDQIAEKRIGQVKALYLPAIPLSVAKRAQEAATSTGVTFILLVGLVVKLTGKPTVRIRPSLLEQSGLSNDQARRAAGALSEAGLIRVNAAPGKRRKVTLTDAEYLNWLHVGG
jgi:hypothetical protein